MKLFGWKSAGREDSRPVLSRVGASRAPSGNWGGDWAQSYEAQVREGYGGNVIVQRSVRLVADGLGEAPLTVSSPELATLIVARSGGQALLATLAAQLLLHGNAFVQVLTDAHGMAVELFALRPERVRVEPDAGGWPVAVGAVETAAFTVVAGGVVELDVPPAVGVVVTAGFAFDVPVRFAEDRLAVNRATFLAGAAASVPLVEVREE